MVKLTPDLIQKSLQYTNPVKDRELDLRGSLFESHLLALCSHKIFSNNVLF